MTLHDIRTSLRPLAQPVTYMGAAMLVFIYCALAYLVIADRQADYREAEQRGDNLVRLLDSSFSHIFQTADASFLFLRNAYKVDGPKFDLVALTHGFTTQNRTVFDFAIADATGRVIHKSWSKDPANSNVSNREGFQVQVHAPTDELFIGKPVVRKSNNKWSMVLSRRITAPDGTFAGVITALFDPVELVRETSAINLGQDGSIALVGLDGFLRARIVDGGIDWESIGRKVPLSPRTLGRALRTPKGHYWSVPGVFNNVRRLVSYQVLDSFPLIALVTVAEAEIYANANARAQIYWTIVLTLTAAILAAMAFGARRERRLIETTAHMRETQNALAQSQERYRLVESAVNDGIWDWNIVTDEDYLSPRWKTILGYEDSDLPNVVSSFFDLVHPDDKDAVTEAVRAHLEDDKPYALDIRLRCKNGDYRWVHSRGKAVRDAANRPVRMLGTIRDITDRKQAEQALAEANRKLIDLQFAIDQAIIVAVTDVTGSITHANDAFCKISGYSREELLGANNRNVRHASGCHRAQACRNCARAGK